METNDALEVSAHPSFPRRRGWDPKPMADVGSGVGLKIVCRTGTRQGDVVNEKQNQGRDFLGGPVVKTLHTQCRGRGSASGQELVPTCCETWPRDCLKIKRK